MVGIVGGKEGKGQRNEKEQTTKRSFILVCFVLFVEKEKRAGFVTFLEERKEREGMERKRRLMRIFVVGVGRPHSRHRRRHHHQVWFCFVVKRCEVVGEEETDGL